MESAYTRTSQREDASSYVVAVDGEYGQGKSFFLRRLAEQLVISHPVAFVDAWADDLADEPFTALAATLRTALVSHLAKPDVRARWNEFKSKAGAVAKLAAGGILKRTVGLVVTAGVANEIAEVTAGVSEAVQEAVESASTELSGSAVSDSLDALRTIAPAKLIDNEIEAFEARKAAVASMKRSLRRLVESLGDGASSPPIFIIIDELDRCRPTYAVKLLEEVKHLFDVEGLVFVFGLHGGQLAHSVAGAYGPGFDASAYLRRFFHRRFRLADASLEGLVSKLLVDAALSEQRFIPIKISVAGGPSQDVQLGDLIARYMRMYDLAPRDAFEVVDRLLVCASLTQLQIMTLLLVPMICNEIKGRDSRAIEPSPAPVDWQIPYHDVDGHLQRKNPHEAFIGLVRAAGKPKGSLDQLMRSPQPEWGVPAVWERYVAQNELDRLQNYHLLLRAVDKFENPVLNKEAAS